MSKSYLKIVSLSLSVAFVIALLPGLRINALSSGNCGNTATYTMDDEGTLTISGTGAVDYYDAFRYNKSIKKVVIEEGITAIGHNEFDNCSNITSFELPDTLTTISYCAFEDCKSLTSITIPESVTDIGSGAFNECNNLESVTLSNNLGCIEANMFYGCNSLKGITIPNSVKSIEYSAFNSCDSLESITIPDSVTYIGKLAFYNCDNLSSIIFPSSAVTLDERAFCNCDKISSVTIPNAVIGYNAFYGCSNLAEVSVLSGSIGTAAFFECTDLTELTLSDGVKTIGSYAFYGCTGLTDLTIPGSVDCYGAHMFESCTNLESVTILEGAKEIGMYEFSGCSSLKNVTIPDGLETIDIYAFIGCISLESITIPASVTSISNSAFMDCTSITEVTIDKNSQVLYDIASAFNGCPVSEFSYITYDITYNCDKGTITGPESSESTDTVSFTVMPDKNYVLDSVILIENGVTTVLTPDTNGYYSFVMPSNAVTIDSAFSRISADVTFCSEDGTVLQQTNYDLYVTPSYTGEIPTKADADGFTYTFAGWTDGTTTFDADTSLPAVYDDVIYTAVFDEKAKIGTYYLNGIEYKDGTIVFSVKQEENDDLTFDLVDKVISDGKEITNGEQFDLTKGSAVITLKKDYFNSLPAGTHTMEVKFKDGGSISFEYTIKTSSAGSAKSVPATGENMSVTVIIGSGMLLAACGIAGVILIRRRREEA